MGRILAAAAALAIIAASPTVAQARQSRISATLGGSPISLSRIATLHCHDLEYPVIRCYRSERGLRAGVRSSLSRHRWSTASANVSALSYVRIYEHAGLDGASMLLTASYSSLGSIGWNDRISSYKSVNSGRGVFSEHDNGYGIDTGFCCNSMTLSLGSKNDTFSSVYASD